MSDLGRRKIREGLVVSSKMDKTVVVAVEAKKVNPLYKKAVKVTKRYKAHDEKNDCKIGDKVKIIETRPMSREKKWRVIEVISKREVAATKP